MPAHWEIIAGALALVAGLWSHIAMVGAWCRGLVVISIWVDTRIAELVTSYLAEHGRRSPRESVYGIHNLYIRPLDRTGQVALEALDRASALFWRGRRPLWFNAKPEKALDEYAYPFQFSWLRGTVDWERLLLDAIAWKAAVPRNSEHAQRHEVHYHHGKTLGSEIAEQQDEEDPKVERKHARLGRGTGYRVLGWNREDIGGNSLPSTFAALSLTQELDALTQEMRFWHQSRAWYHAHHVVWRRGYMFHGRPGTGKTSLARACAEELDMPVHVFDLASMSNEDLRRAWGKMIADAPCMALIEDIDAVFKGRDNVSRSGGMMSSGGLTFDSLLNCIDGVERVDGIVVVVTTNHLDRVDQALTDRPGRIDRVIEFGPLDFVGRLKLARQILGDEGRAHDAALSSGDVPAAHFVERCCRDALSEHFKAGPYR